MIIASKQCCVVAVVIIIVAVAVAHRGNFPVACFDLITWWMIWTVVGTNVVLTGTLGESRRMTSLLSMKSQEAKCTRLLMTAIVMVPWSC